MYQHQHRAILDQYGAYEMTGLLDAQYHPYHGIGEDPVPEPTISANAKGGIAQAILEAAARSMCLTNGNAWDDSTKQCLTPAGVATDPALDFCIKGGGQWDAVKRLCLPPGAPEPAPPPNKGIGTTGWVMIAGVVALAVYAGTRGKRRATPNRRRRRRSRA